MIRALAGDADAYQNFLTQVSTLMRPMLLRLTRSRGLAAEQSEDLLQDILLTLHRKRELYRPSLPIVPWINAVAKHRFIDQLRSDQRRPILTEWDDAYENIGTQAPTAEFEQTENSNVATDALLHGLTDRQKKILTLAKVDDVPLAAIATRMQMSVAAVKVSIHRSLKQIRKTHAQTDPLPKELSDEDSHS